MYAGMVVEQGTRRPDLLRPPAPVHVGPARARSPASTARPRARLPSIAGLSALAHQPPRGLPLRAALPAPIRGVLRAARRSSARAGDPGHLDRCWLAPEDKVTRRLWRAASASRPTWWRDPARESDEPAEREALVGRRPPQALLPDPQRAARRPRGRPGARRRRRLAAHRARRDLRARGRVGLRQVHAGALHPAAARAHRRVGALRGHATSPAWAAARCARCAATCR